MKSQYSYGYLKEAVTAHLDLEESELSLNNISARFHLFANEAIQQICATRPKYTYFTFDVVSAFEKLVHSDGILRLATQDELNWEALGATEPTFASEAETIEWYNTQGIYLQNQVVEMPDDFLSFASRQAFFFTDFITNKTRATSSHYQVYSTNELVPFMVGTYMIPYRATWVFFDSITTDKDLVPMPSDLALTIPLYVASVHLQQQNLSLAQAKRQEFEIALSRCKSTDDLPNITINSSYE